MNIIMLIAGAMLAGSQPFIINLVRKSGRRLRTQKLVDEWALRLLPIDRNFCSIRLVRDA